MTPMTKSDRIGTKRATTDISAHLSRPAAIVGTTGAGKTFAAKGAVEALLEQKRRVLIIDPTGVWYGLRSGAKGVGGGFPVLIFGGDNADIDITPDSGSHLARTLAVRDVQAIIDVSDMTGNEKKRFLTDFLETLYAVNRAALHLVVDEADEIAPQNPMPEERRLSGAFDKIVRRGRVKGFRPLMITQRPAVLHKNVLSQIGTLIALKLTSPQDRKAIDDWVKGNADADQAKAVMRSLPTLKQGEGWVWSPEDHLLERVQFPAIKTFDSSRTPGAGEQIVAPALGDVDVAELRAAIAALSDTAEPAKNKRGDAADIAAAEKRGFDRGHREGYAEGVAIGWRKALDQVSSSLSQLVPPTTAAAPAMKIMEGAIKATSTAPPAKAKKATEGNGSVAGMPTGPQQTLLNSLSWWEAAGHDAPSRAMVAAVCGWAIRSGHLKNVLGQSRSAGFVDYPTQGSVSLTDRGRDLAHAPNGTMHDRLMDLLKGPQRSVYTALLETGAINRVELAAAVGWSPDSGHMKNVLGSLRTMDIVQYPASGLVDLTDWVRSTGGVRK